MQVSTTLLIVAAEIYLMLLIGMLVVFLYSRKQKKIIDRQQQKLLELIKEIRQTHHTAITPKAVEKGYKFYLNQQLDVTQKHFANISNQGDISAEQPLDCALDQRILALRYAFLRAEELGTTEEPASEKYWSIFQQTLEPLLQVSPNQNLLEELSAYKKRVENLEKFKKLFFDLEAQWNAAQNNSEDYHAQLLALSGQMSDPNAYEELLASYQSIYGDFGQSIKHTSGILDNPDSKTINIIRQDPRAAEEIVKLRNVAADQYRVINNLQRKLEEATSDEQKTLIIKELEQQLQRQIRFVQESDTCVQLLEEELIKANEKIAEQEELITQGEFLDEENLQIKDTLHSFTLESKDLLENMEALEEENQRLRDQLDMISNAAPATSNPAPGNQELLTLQKQYAELEERYLTLKMK
jgi:hypothetical protein